MPNFKKNKGFTLLEILLVVGIIAILAGIVIIAINPGRQLATVRNTQREFNLNEINKAITQFYIDHSFYPASTTVGSGAILSTSLAEICATGASSSPAAGFTCTSLINLSELVPTYLTAIPTDPSGASSTLTFLDKLIPTAYANPYGTGYQIVKNANNKIGLSAPLAELGRAITIGSVPTLGVGLVAHYLMNDTNGTTAVDAKGSNTGTGTYTPNGSGKIGGALGFGGSNSVTISNLNVGTGGKTYVIWAKLNANPDTSVLIEAFAGNEPIYMAIAQNKLVTYYNTLWNGSQAVGAFSNGEIGSWIQFAITLKTDGTVQLYKNGSPLSMSVNDSYVAGDGVISSMILGTNGGVNNFLTGSLDDFRIYNRVLTTDEITQLYNGGAGTEAQ